MKPGSSFPAGGALLEVVIPSEVVLTGTQLTEVQVNHVVYT